MNKGKARNISRVKSGPDDCSGMSVIVKTVTRLSIGIILLYGINLILRGHIAPGGGFAGGGIITLAFLNLILAYGKKMVLPKLWRPRAELICILGLAGFLGLILTGSARDNLNCPFIAPGIIIGANILAAMVVGGGFLSIFIALLFSDAENENK